MVDHVQGTIIGNKPDPSGLWQYFEVPFIGPPGPFTLAADAPKPSGEIDGTIAFDPTSVVPLYLNGCGFETGAST